MMMIDRPVEILYMPSSAANYVSNDHGAANKTRSSQYPFEGSVGKC